MRINVGNCVVAVVFATLVVSCNGFFWNTQPAEQQVSKQLPMMSFRTYTYHPLTVQTQQFPASFRYMQPSQSVPVNYVTKSTPGTFTAQTILAPANIIPQQAPIQAQPVPIQQQQPLQQQAPLTMMSQPSNIDLSNALPSPAAQYSAQYSAQPMAQQAMPMRQNSFYQDNYNYAYNPPSPQMNMQQVQFVPCMCPVTVSMTGEASQAEKRSDEVLLTGPMEAQPNISMEPAAVENKI